MKASLILLVVAVAVLAPSSSSAQDMLPLPESAESHYYDFWLGTWHQVVDGKIDTTRTMFRVEPGPHRAAFIERWLMLADRSVVSAVALRAWDKTARRWMYTWVSANGLHQVWEGRQVGNDWYIFREFDIQGDKYLSRQGWFPAGPDRVVRISERSNDGGVTWQLRFREEYQRATK